MKKIILIILILISLIGLPLYAAGRILAPEWIKNQIFLVVPDGADLSIGSINSAANLAVTYEEISYQSQDLSFFIPKLVVSPRISLTEPIIVKANSIAMRRLGQSLSATDLTIKINPKGVKLNDLEFNGSVASVNDENLLKMEATKFLISSITNSSFDMEITGEKVDFTYQNQITDLNTSLLDFKFVINLTNELKVDLSSKSGEISFGYKNIDSEMRTFFTDEVTVEFAVIKESVWTMPLSVILKNINSAEGLTFSSFQVNGTGEWNDQSKSCDMHDLLGATSSCGKLINVLQTTAELSRSKGQIYFSGDGFCVAPNSGCRQKIFSKISSKNTTEIFSALISSGLVNPLVGGVLLGGMLSSPTNDLINTNHEISLDVNGSQIFINGEPLIK